MSFVVVVAEIYLLSGTCMKHRHTQLTNTILIICIVGVDGCRRTMRPPIGFIDRYAQLLTHDVPVEQGTVEVRFKEQCWLDVELYPGTYGRARTHIHTHHVSIRVEIDDTYVYCSQWTNRKH